MSSSPTLLRVVGGVLLIDGILGLFYAAVFQFLDHTVDWTLPAGLASFSVILVIVGVLLVRRRPRVPQ
jgi:hypothetical protein